MMPLTLNRLSVQIGQQTLCRELTLTLSPGEVVGILGPNGSGKSTLLQTWAGLHKAWQGEIKLGEHQLNHLPVKTVAKTVGILFQELNAVLPQTVWQYCLAARFPHLPYFQRETAQDQDIVHQALRQMALDTLSKREVTTLSGGEKRRVAIAALLAQTPQIYLLDEPTNHLDIHHQVLTLRHFRDLAQTAGKTVVMVLHDVNWAQHYCDRVLLLGREGEVRHGKVAAVLTASNLTWLYGCSMSQSTQPFWWPHDPIGI